MTTKVTDASHLLDSFQQQRAHPTEHLKKGSKSYSTINPNTSESHKVSTFAPLKWGSVSFAGTSLISLSLSYCGFNDCSPAFYGIAGASILVGLSITVMFIWCHCVQTGRCKDGSDSDSDD